jgi:hypothetical protein
MGCGNIAVPDLPTVTALPQPLLGAGGLCGAFTDSEGNVVEAIAIGAASRKYIVPPGASQLQLGVDDDGLSNNSGTGFTVPVNGIFALVPPTTTPWNWQSNGVNQNYRFGENDGTPPVVAINGLTPGDVVVVGPSMGSVSITGSLGDATNADGALSWITGTRPYYNLGTFPTYYMTGISNPAGEAVPLSAAVMNWNGTPLPNILVTAHITGANVQDLTGVTDSTGVAAFTYLGSNPGTDNVIFEANGGSFTSVSAASSISIVNATQYWSVPELGTLSISPKSVSSSRGGTQKFTLQAQRADGSPALSLGVTLYIVGADKLSAAVMTNSSGMANYTYKNAHSGQSFLVAVATIDGMAVYSNTVSMEW